MLENIHAPSPLVRPPLHRVVALLLLKGIVAMMVILVLAGTTGWSALAVYYGDSATSTLRTVLAIVIALVGIVTIFGVFTTRWRRIALGGFLLQFVIVLVWWLNIAPSNNRTWQTDVARLPYATFDGDHVTVHDVRNFTYRTESDYTPAYYDETYDLNRLDRVDLFFVYWMGPAIAHTIVSFGFGDQDFLAISIEARKEKGEGYSAIKGFFRQYELIYIVADEHDVIRLRTDYRKDPPEDVYRFRLKVTRETARKFFLEYMRAINDLRDRPQFYNTLTANCTNLIWVLARVNPDRVPFSWRILASGYVPKYLYEMGRLDASVSFDELKEAGYVNPIAQKVGDDADFSRKIRGVGPPDG